LCCFSWAGRLFGGFVCAVSGGFSGEAMSPIVSGEAVLGWLPGVVVSPTFSSPCSDDKYQINRPSNFRA